MYFSQTKPFQTLYICYLLLSSITQTYKITPPEQTHLQNDDLDIIGIKGVFGQEYPKDYQLKADEICESLRQQLVLFGQEILSKYDSCTFEYQLLGLDHPSV